MPNRRTSVLAALLSGVLAASCAGRGETASTQPDTTTTIPSSGMAPTSASTSTTSVVTTAPTPSTLEPTPTSTGPTTTSTDIVDLVGTVPSGFDPTDLIGLTMINDEDDLLPAGYSVSSGACVGDPAGEICSHALKYASTDPEHHLVVLQRMLEREDLPDGRQRISWLVVDVLYVEFPPGLDVFLHQDCWSESGSGISFGAGVAGDCARVTPVAAWRADWRAERIVEVVLGAGDHCQQICD